MLSPVRLAASGALSATGAQAVADVISGTLGAGGSDELADEAALLEDEAVLELLLAALELLDVLPVDDATELWLLDEAVLPELEDLLDEDEPAGAELALELEAGAGSSPDPPPPPPQAARIPVTARMAA